MDRQTQIVKAVNELREMKIDAHHGLPEELFLFISGIMPIPNVDLMITNEKKQLLLAWRQDSFFGEGWHIPGGCIRYGESMLERVQKTAMEEIGTQVIVNKEPIVVKDVLRGDRDGLKYPNERGHHITILFDCKLPPDFEIDNNKKKENDVGYLKWFDVVPDNILKVHDVYKEILKEWERRK